MTKILIVEDSKIPAMALKHKIKMHIDAEVMVAHNSQEAIDLAKDNYFDLILMDIGLGPGPDGIDTTKKIREIEKKENREPSFICALTAHVHADSPEKHKNAGMDHTFEKPLDLEKIDFLFKKVPALQKIKSP